MHNAPFLALFPICRCGQLGDNLHVLTNAAAMEIKLSEISFIEQLKESESSCVFRVHWHDKDCVMKVVCHCIPEALLNLFLIVSHGLFSVSCLGSISR